MEDNDRLLLRNGRVWRGKSFVDADIAVADGKITQVAPSLPEDGARVIDCSGLSLFPSFVDMHVHLREPGYSYKETIYLGSRAAAAGGFTTVCTMPNLNPVPDSRETLQTQLDIIDRDAAIRVWPYASITRKRMGEELVDYEALAPYVAGFSDDGSGVQSEDVMRRAMAGIAHTGKILAAHCEVNDLLRGGYIHDGRWCRTHGHKGICSESEWREVERDIKLAADTGCRLHICHISTKESVALLRDAKKDGLNVTGETAPHYLLLCDEDLQDDGRFKMNPPLRSPSDRQALLEGIADGTIDVIATDHAPHSLEEKSRGLALSAMGVVGLETAFAASYTALVASGIVGIDRLVELMALRPRDILGLPQSWLTPGDPADIAGIALDRDFKVVGSEFVSKGKVSVFEGMTLRSVPVLTLHNGAVVSLRQ